jgi:hypothetical protein
MGDESIGKLLLQEMLGVSTSNSTLIYRLMHFVLVRVISWIILFGRVKRTIHEITRTNTNKKRRGKPSFDTLYRVVRSVK